MNRNTPSQRLRASSTITRNAAEFGRPLSIGTAVADHRGPMKSTSYRTAVIAFKRDLVEQTLAAHGGNRTHAARALGVPRTYLLRLIRRLGAGAPLSRAHETSSGRAPWPNEHDAFETREAASHASGRKSSA